MYTFVYYIKLINKYYLLYIMKRRIVQHGSSSLTVTLPHAWVEKHRLKKGDELDVEVAEDTLTLAAKTRPIHEKKLVEVTDFGVFTKNNLTHLYMLGYDELEIQFSDERELRDIQERVPECIGYEIIDQKPNRVFIKSIAHTLESDFDTLLRKAFIITSEMGKEVLNAIKKKEFAKLKELRYNEGLNNKFTMACARILSKQSRARAMQIYDVIMLLERIADEHKYICDLLADNKKAVKPELIALFGKVNSYFDAFQEIFYKFGPELKKRIYLERKSLLKDALGLVENAGGKDAVLAHHLVNIVAKTYECAGGYFASIL